METTSREPLHSDDSPFRLDVHRVDGTALVAAHGELDLASADELERTLLELIEHHRVVTLDLRELDFLDSTGITVLVGAHAAAGERGTSLYVVRGPERVQRVLAITTVDEHLAMIDDPDEAGGAGDPPTPPPRAR